MFGTASRRFRIACFLAALAILTAMAPSTSARPYEEGAQTVAAEAPAALVPNPASVTWTQDPGFQVRANTAVIAPQDSTAATHLAELLRQATGYPIPVRQAGLGAGYIRLATVHDDALGEEGYRLRSNRRNVVIEAGTDAGHFYGVQTMRQLLPAAVERGHTDSAVAWTVPGVEIFDRPRFDYRGVQLDVARSFLTVAEVKRHIDALVQFKMNVLHLHLTDDQGWRIEITNEGRAAGDTIDYSLLSEVSGAIAKRTSKHGTGVIGYYTQDDYREIVQYAASRHVTVVPEVDMPGHSRGALHAIPELNTPGTVHSDPHPPAGGTLPDNGWTAGLDPHSEATYQFARHVLTQLAEMTPGPYIHVGADEARLETTDFNYFLSRVLPMTRALGKAPIGWDEYSPNAAEGDVVQHWHTAIEDRTVDAAQRGASVIASPANLTYLNRRYSADSWPGTSPSRDVRQYYSWDPVTTLAPLVESDFLGVEAPLWSETVRGNDSAQYLVLPRAAATLEIGWSPRELRDVDDFVERLSAFGGRFTLGGHNYFDTPQVPWQSGLWPLKVPTLSGHCEPAALALLTAPGTTASDITVTIEWSDGVVSDAVLTLDQEPDRLHATGLYTISTSRPAPAMPGIAHRDVQAMVTATTPNGVRSAVVNVSFDHRGGLPPGSCDHPNPAEPAARSSERLVSTD